MPMCCIVKCSARKNENQPQLSFHRFPRAEGLKKKWLEAIGEENINPRHKVWYLCSLHFEESCFNRTLAVLRLHDNSVPTVFSTPGAVRKSQSVPNDAAEETPRTGRQRWLEPLEIGSLLRPRGWSAALSCEPIKVTSGPSPVLQNSQLQITRSPVITERNSEVDPIKQEEDRQSEDTNSVAEDEDIDQLSDTDQPSEDPIPLSNAQVPLSNALDPLSDVKVEELEVGVEDVEATGPEEVNRSVEVSRAVELPKVPLPLHLRQELLGAGNNCYNLIRKQAKQINKLTVRCGKYRQKLHSYVQIVRRRNKKISSLQAEVLALRHFIGERGWEASTIGGAKLHTPRIQIQNSNKSVEENKLNRQLLIVKRDYNRQKSLVSVQPTSDILQTSVGVKSTDILKKCLLDALNKPDDLQKSSDGIPDTSDVLQKSKVGVKRTLGTRQKSSVAVQRTPTIPKSSQGGLQSTSNINIKQSSDRVSCTSDVVQKSSAGISGMSNVIQKSSVNFRRISDINIQKSPFGCQPTLDVRPTASDGIKRISDIISNPSIVVQPLSDIPRTSVVGFQRRSDIRQNTLVIQIDGMHNTVPQPKLVKLDDNGMETS